MYKNAFLNKINVVWGSEFMAKLEKAQQEYDELRKKVWDGVLTEIYSKDEKTGENYTKKFNSIVEGSDYNDEKSIENAKKKISFLEKQMIADLASINKKLGLGKTKAKTKVERKSIRKSIPAPAPAPEPAPAPAPAAPKESPASESGGEQDVKEIIKDAAKVKSYIKSKFGSFNDINNFIGEMATKYKAKNEYMPIKDLRRIYGTKGGLMMIYRLENEGPGGKKAKSTYRKYCEKILKDYRSLKVEAAVLALESGTVDIKNFSEEDAKELKRLVDEIVKLKNNDGSDKYNEIYDHFFKYLAHLTTLSLGIAVAFGGAGALTGALFALLPAMMACVVLPPVGLGILGGGAAIGGALGISAAGMQYISNAANIVVERNKMKEAEKKLKEELKNLKGNDGAKRLINKVLKMAEKVSEDKINATSIKAQQDYVKKYNSFVEKSGKLASRYLSWVGKDKRDRLKTAQSGEVVAGRDLVIDAYKIIFMCLVAVCSKNKSQIKAGTKFFSKNRKVLEKFVK